MNVHTTIGLYANGSFKSNGVKSENLEAHIEYNKENRPGRSLFVDGKCVYIGIYHSEIEVKKFEREIAENPQWTKTIDTAPYQ